MTRDYVEERSVLEGAVVSLVATAGVRESRDPVGAEGIRRSRRQMLEADFLILPVDASQPAGDVPLKLLEEFRERSPLIVPGRSLGEIPRETAGEEFVDRIFSKFCIGK